MQKTKPQIDHDDEPKNRLGRLPLEQLDLEVHRAPVTEETPPFVVVDQSEGSRVGDEPILRHRTVAANQRTTQNRHVTAAKVTQVQAVQSVGHHWIVSFVR